MFTKMGKLIASVGVLYALFDFYWIFSVQYSEFLEIDFPGPSEAGRAAGQVGMIEDIGDALRLLAFSVALGVLTDISTLLARPKSATQPSETGE